MVKTVKDEVQENYDLIYECRLQIAQLKKDKIIARSEAWEDASGTAKEKEDFVRSVVAGIDKDIAVNEAKIERAYNINRLLDNELMFGEMENE